MIAFKVFDPLSKEDCRLLAKWENDPSIRHLFNFFPDKDAFSKTVTPDEIAERSLHDQNAKSFHRWIILKGDEPVGEMNFSIDAKQLFTKLPATAWIGIVIGEESARGTGTATEAMRFLESQAKAKGAKRIELGVFEFNERAIKFYRKLNYREITRIPEFTYWNGKKWSDIRMLKELVS